MNIKEQIGKILVALVLFIALMTPNVTQFVHLLEGHEHHIITCDDHSESHVHKYETKCDLCCSFFTPLNYELSKHSYLIHTKIIVKSEVKFTSLLLHSFKITNTLLRGPPTIS